MQAWLIAERKLVIAACVAAMILAQTFTLGLWLNAFWVGGYLLYVVGRWVRQHYIFDSAVDEPATHFEHASPLWLRRRSESADRWLKKTIGDWCVVVNVIRSVVRSVLLTVFLLTVHDAQRVAAPPGEPNWTADDSLWLLFALAVFPVGERWDMRMRHFCIALVAALGGLVISEGTGFSLIHKAICVSVLSFAFYVIMLFVSKHSKALRDVRDITIEVDKGTKDQRTANVQIQDLVTRGQEIFGFHRLAYMKVDPTEDGYRFQVIAIKGKDEERLRRQTMTIDRSWQEARPDRLKRRGTYRFVVEERHPYTTNDGESDRHFLRAKEMADVKSETIDPVMIGGQTVGILTANAPTTRAFWPFHEVALRLLSHNIARIIASDDTNRYASKLYELIRQELKAALTAKEDVVEGVVLRATQLAVQYHSAKVAIGYALAPNGHLVGPIATGCPCPSPVATTPMTPSHPMSRPFHVEGSARFDPTVACTDEWNPPFVREVWQPPTMYSRAILHLDIGSEGRIGILYLYFDTSHPLLEPEQRRLHTFRTTVATMLGRAREARPPRLSIVSAPDPYGLTKRELEVFGLHAAGLSNGEIAERLVLSIHSVASYIRDIRSKTGTTGQGRGALTGLWYREYQPTQEKPGGASETERVDFLQQVHDDDDPGQGLRLSSEQ